MQIHNAEVDKCVNVVLPEYEEAPTRVLDMACITTEHRDTTQLSWNKMLNFFDKPLA